tara:strand:+ start:1057 stop:1554 length:498 start_codon:yes stop_codon:yes gene_type:complete
MRYIALLILLLLSSSTFSEESFPSTFNTIVIEVQKEYSPDSFERKINPLFVTTVASVETANGTFKNADTARRAKNYTGRHAIGNEKFLLTAGGVKLKKYDSIEDSIRDFLSLMTHGRYYKEFRIAVKEGKPIEDQFKTLTKYATNPNYTDILLDVYKKIKKGSLN